jgi:hypothetical protein
VQKKKSFRLSITNQFYIRLKPAMAKDFAPLIPKPALVKGLRGLLTKAGSFFVPKNPLKPFQAADLQQKGAKK